jgi:hypothetical protein
MTCGWENCDRPTRARGFCDTHYRRVRRIESGVDKGGSVPKDGAVYKIRVWRPTGAQPYYYSDFDKALIRVAEARADGTLLYFAKYILEERLDR